MENFTYTKFRSGLHYFVTLRALHLAVIGHRVKRCLEHFWITLPYHDRLDAKNRIFTQFCQISYLKDLGEVLFHVLVQVAPLRESL